MYSMNPSHSKDPPKLWIPEPDPNRLQNSTTKRQKTRFLSPPHNDH